MAARGTGRDGDPAAGRGAGRRVGRRRGWSPGWARLRQATGRPEVRQRLEAVTAAALGTLLVVGLSAQAAMTGAGLDESPATSTPVAATAGGDGVQPLGGTQQAAAVGRGAALTADEAAAREAAAAQASEAAEAAEAADTAGRPPVEAATRDAAEAAAQAAAVDEAAEAARDAVAPGPPAPPAPAAPPGPSPGAEEDTRSAREFAERFPRQAAARQTADPATRHWAVLVGVDDYQDSSDLVGSVADTRVLREVLLAHGWREDHILVLNDADATNAGIVRGLQWLARNTDETSTVVFSYSGHLRHEAGVSALWPSDGRFIWAGELGGLLGQVRAGKMWASLQGCHAEGLRAPGVEGPNRVVTYSSQTAEKSYEDPAVGHSVQGYFLFAESFRDGWGDLDGDGAISVQEAHERAAPRAHRRSAWRQSPVLSDGLGQPFHLGVG